MPEMRALQGSDHAFLMMLAKGQGQAMRIHDAGGMSE
jgi:hypothetical protein